MREWHADVLEAVRLHRGPYHLAVVFGSEQAYAGTIILEPLRDPGQSVELTIALHPRAQRQTVGPRAAMMVIRWLLDSGVHRVETRHSPTNSVSCRGSTGIGLPKEGVARAGTPIPNDGVVEWQDTCIHAVVNEAHPRVEESQPAADPATR